MESGVAVNQPSWHQSLHKHSITPINEPVCQDSWNGSVGGVPEVNSFRVLTQSLPSIMANLKQTPLTCSGHTRPVVHLAFSDITDCGYFLISACKDGQPMLRQGDTGDWIGTFMGHKGAVWGVALNRDATRAATGSADSNAKLWDAITGEEIHSFQHNRIIKGVAFSKDSNSLVTGSTEKLIRVFDINKPDACPSVISGHSGALKDVAFLGEDKIASIAQDKTLRLWDRRTGTQSQSVTFRADPNSMEISKDESIISISHGCSVSFWKINNGLELFREVTIPTQVNSASLHPDRTIFVCGGEDLKMYKFDYTTGCEIESFKGHFGPIHCVRFSPDGELYASGSEDGTLRLWQTTVGKTYGLWKCVDSSENACGVVAKTEVPSN